MSKVNGKEFLSDLKLYSDYLKWDEKLQRYETWEEACEKVLDTHRKKYGKKIEKYLKEVAPLYYNKELLASQRSLQFRGEKIFQHNARLYNCFHKEEKFVTSEGVKSFSDFKQGDKIKVLTHKGQWKDAIVGKYGEQMLNKVYLKRGASEENIVKVTENHRWILQDGTETTTLAVGDRLYKPHNTFSEFDFENATPFEKLYWCYGFVYGDGTKVKNDGVHKYSMVRLCGNDIKYLDRFKEMGFETSSSLSLKGDVMVYTGKYLKIAPNPKEDSPELIRAFVAGYLTADGEKTKNDYGNKYNTIQSSEKDHIKFIRECFPIAGVWLISEKDLTGQETNYGKRPYTILFRISTTMGSKYNSGWKVEKIERDKQEEVWCLEVEDDNSFVMPNGIVTGNCTVSYAYSPDVLNKGFYVLLCGCGLGVSLRQKFIKQLPTIDKRNNDVKLYVIPDTIEGWAESIKVLMSSYCKHPSLYKEYYGFQIKFDYSQIRPKGALISGGYKAPGHEGLQQSLERIEQLLNNNIGEFKSIIMYDIFMHLSDAVLSGGVRRSAQNMIFDYDDKDMLNAKIGNWRQHFPHRARSNNSVALQRNNFSKETFKELITLNQGDNDVGFVIVNGEDDLFNPCFEIGFNFYDKIVDKNEAVFHFCNLNETNASSSVDEKGNFSKEKFFKLCRAAAILGTLQAGYTDFPYLGKQTEEIVKGEALLGISITGWMTRPELFDKEILTRGAEIVKETNIELAQVININPSARATTVKPSGNSAVILQTASGIHPEHSQRYFRVMQLNKGSEVAKYLEENHPELLEESAWSATNSDYVVFTPCENENGVIIKDNMQGVKHLELIELVKTSWVDAGKTEELCYNKNTSHNVSNTVIIDDIDTITDYIFEHQDNFTAVSFINAYGDKDYKQAPFTSILTTKEIFDKYGDGAMFMSGLIVDGLHYFNGDLWEAIDCVIKQDIQITGTKEQILLRKDWVRRVKKFSKNYFKSDLKQTVYCMKDIYLWHKWQVITKSLKKLDYTKILTKPVYTDIDKLGAIACNGGQCDI